MVLRQVRHYAILAQLDQGSSGGGQSLLGVGRIAVVGRDHPLVVRELHLERSGRRSRLVVVDHFDGLRRLRIREVSKEQLAHVVKDVRCRLAGIDNHGGRGHHDRSHYEIQSLGRFVHCLLVSTKR